MPENEIGQALLDEIQRLGLRFERLEGRMSSFEGRMSSFEGRMSSMEGRMSNIEAVVADLDGRIKAWPDMHYLGAAARAQLTQTREIKTQLAETRVRIDEIYQAMATDPEIKSLRDEVARFRDQSVETEVRLGTIEGHVGITSSVEPR